MTMQESLATTARSAVDMVAGSSGLRTPASDDNDGAFSSSRSDVQAGNSSATSISAGTDGPSPIAICGMSCRLPGGIHAPQQLWDFLISKGDARSRVPKSRYNIDAFYDPSGTGKPGMVKTEYGYFLDESIDIGALDGSFFNLPRNAMERADPHQRQILEVAREAIDDAGEVNWRGGLIGCYVGTFGEDWVEMFAKDSQQFGLDRVSGYGDFMLANRVSYEMDIRGPSMTIRTGCSAALVCLHEAVNAIQQGDCTSAIVGGVNLLLAPGMTQAMTEQGVLSPDGSCKTFSSDANGYGRGEAVSAVYLKPLAAALRDGNPVRAVIRGTATNSDGKTPGISYPSTEAHEAVMRKAYSTAGISDFSQTTFVECHGTGTPIGDPIESNAVARVFGDSPGGVYIGSVKPNLGHSEGASGLTSLIKAVLALENRVIPPNIKFNSPNPNIPFKSRNLVVPTEPTPWPEDGGERVSVNSFGIGGANAHVVLDSARSVHAAPPAPVKKEQPDAPQLLLFSANSNESLKAMTDNYQAFLEKNPDRLGDLAYTLAHGREHFAYRAFRVATPDKAGALSTIVRAPIGSRQKAPGVVMVFTGQGAQWPQMGKELIQSHHVFRSTIRCLDQHLQRVLPESQWTIEDELLKPSRTSRLGLAEFSQPLCTAVQLALVDTLAAAGIHPTAVVGHSSGEIAAAYAAGVLTAEEAIVIAHFRGTAAKTQAKSGSMAAIGAGWDDVKPYLVPGVTVACENSPKSITISGDTDKVQHVVAAIKESPPNGQETMARLLKVDKAYHSHHMAEIGSHYQSLLETHGVSARGTPKCAFFSTVHGRLLEEGEGLGPEYWRKNLESPVLFATGVSRILEHSIGKNAVFLEVGPHAALAGPLRQITAQVQGSQPVPYAAAMSRSQHCGESLLTAIGKLHQLAVPLDLETVIPRGSGTLLPDLPRYPWSHQDSYWYESRLSKEWRHRKFPYHDLLGVRLAESTDVEPAWRNVFHLDNAPWVRDHKIIEDVVFPFSGYVALAGEAIRQVAGAEEGYGLRHVIVSTALVLTEGKPAEIVTTLRPHRLTDSLDSQFWWEFTVSSHNGQTWTKHCVGQVRPLQSSLGAAAELPVVPRALGQSKAYSLMAEAGLCYGPAFQSLEDIAAGTLDRAAAAVVRKQQGDEGYYHMHPVTIDACLQLLSVAATRGYHDRHGMVMPTSIESLSIRRCGADVDITVSATAQLSRLGAITGDTYCSANGETVLQMKGAKLSPVPGESDADARDTHTTARYEWGPHVDFMDLTTLVHASEEVTPYSSVLSELTQLCIAYSQRRLSDITTELTHMQLYASWIQRQSGSVSPEIRAMKDWELFNRANSLVQSLSSTPVAAVALAMLKVLSSTTSVARGQLSPFDILLSDDTLTKVDALKDAYAIAPLLKNLAHSKPNLRVLELGAGTGAATVDNLAALTHNGGCVRYSNYTFADSQSGMIVAAKERFKAHPNMSFVALDVRKDLAEQDFEGQQFDVVIASNVLHATPSLKDSLANVRSLLKPGGLLVLQELWPASKWINFICGILPSWWVGAGDQRADEPYVDLSRWKMELKDAGFDVPAAAVGGELNNIVLVRPAAEKEKASSVTLLTLDDSASASLKAVTTALEKQGHKIQRHVLGDAIPTDRDVIALLDIDAPFFSHLDETRYTAFKALAEGLGSKGGIFWVTRPSQVGLCQDPAYAQVLGAARTIRTELGVDFATCEVEDVASSGAQIADVFGRFHARKEGEMTDFEYAVVDAKISVGRFYPFALADELVSTDEKDRVLLETERAGLLSALKWARRASEPLEGDQVEVQTYSAGLNFRDVLSANGIVEVPDEGFGLEASGVISRVGPNCKDMRVGDRVMLFSRGSFATSIIVSEKLCVVIPDSLSFEDAATMPCVYATAMYSLFNIGRLQRGQSVLIHSACGGVGIAAIQLARMAGADIFVTVGNDEKVRYLQDTFHIPRDRIFNSRDDSFVADVHRATNGKGVDLALNSLSGELLHATWRCIAEFGTMVEIGKRDLLGSGKLDMDVFLANRSYCCVDLDQICFKRREICKELLKSVVECYNNGHILPVRPIKVFPASSIHEAFQYMQQGKHMGKIVVGIRGQSQDDVKLDMSVATKTVDTRLDSSASYLLVGGLGGLGRAVSRWLVEHNARRLVYLSRSAGATTKPEDKDFIRELESMGCEVVLVKGSVSDAEGVRKAIAAAPNLKGILQMSMVLRDEGFSRMTLDQWTEACAPKIEGTWNLHHATQDAGLVLDFFVLFSSISGVIGQPGQANYAAANTFLDAFARYRRSLGLAVSAIDIGAVDGIGVISNNENLRRAMKATGAYMIKEHELLEAVRAAIHLSPSTSHTPTAVTREKEVSAKNAFVLGLASTLPLNSPDNRSIWKNDVRMAAYQNISSADSSSASANASGLKTFLNTSRHDAAVLKDASTAALFADEIGKKLCALILKPEGDLQTNVPLAELGMDSLVAIEMRSWWRQVFGFDISVLELLGMGSLDALGAYAVEKMLAALQ